MRNLKFLLLLIPALASAQVKISQLPQATALAGTEPVAVVQGGQTVQTTTSAIAGTLAKVTTISTTGGTTNLSASQTASEIVEVTGTLASNVTIVFPAGVIWNGQIVNLAVAGSFTVSFQTSGQAATATVIAQGGAAPAASDGATLYCIGNGANFWSGSQVFNSSVAMNSSLVVAGAISSGGTVLVSNTVTIWVSEDASRTNAPIGAVAQNSTKLISFYLPVAITTLNNIYFFIFTADNSTNQYDLGIYGPNCNNGNTNVPLVLHTGAQNGSSFATASASQGHLQLSGAPVSVNMVPGWYCWANTSSAATPSMVFGGTNIVTGFGEFGAGASPGGSTGTTSGGVLNSTITAPALGATPGNEVWFVVY